MGANPIIAEKMKWENPKNTLKKKKLCQEKNKGGGRKCLQTLSLIKED